MRTLRLDRFLQLLFVWSLLPSPAPAAEPPRTLALADFAVRASESKAAESAWLGPALAELLQAKMQLFSGARTVERMHLRSLIAAAGKSPALSKQEAPEFLSIVPADVLIAGSVEVSPGAGRIRVRARAFETQTSKILSETVFEGTAELSGLLEVSEELARVLASGLGLDFTPEQLGYAEPANIDTLKLYIVGNDHFRAERYRDAVGAYQQALDGNAGTYYAAAHRMQGEAYQALARSNEGPEGQKVREEYLRKFKEDALAASGAIFDLGQAYEANGMWTEAVDAYGDYVTAAGSGGIKVLWKYDFSGFGRSSIEDFLHVENRIHLVLRSKADWNRVVLDTGTGALIRSAALDPPLEEGYSYRGTAGVSEELIILHEQRSTTEPVRMGDKTFMVGTDKIPDQQRLVAFGPEGHVLWRRDVLSGFGRVLRRRLAGRRLFVEVLEMTEEESRKQYYQGKKFVLMLDVEDGRIMERTGIAERDDSSLWFGLDPWRATLSVGTRVYDLSTGSVSAAEPGKSPPVQRTLPTGREGITYREDAGGIRFYKRGEETLLLHGCTLPRDQLMKSGQSSKSDEMPLLLSKGKGFVLVDPDTWTTTEYYADYRGDRPPNFLAGNASFLLFRLDISPDQNQFDMRYGFAATKGTSILNLWEASTGRLLAKTPTPDGLTGVNAMVGGDIIMANFGKPRTIERWSLLAQNRVDGVPAAEAHLRMAACLQELGRDGETLEHLDQFERGFPGDVRGALLRLKTLARTRKAEEAGRLAYKLMISGGLTDAELQALLPAVQAVSPIVKGALRATMNGDLEFKHVLPSGLILAAPHRNAGDEANSVVSLLDPKGGRSRSLATPELWGRWYSNQFVAEPLVFRDNFVYAGVVYRGGELFRQGRPGNETGAWQVGFVRIDLLTGARVTGDLLPGSRVVFLPGPSLLALVGAGDQQQLLALDPDDLSIRSREPLGKIDDLPLFAGNGTAVLASEVRIQTLSPARESVTREEGATHVVVVDLATGEVLLRHTVELHREEVVRAVADRTALVLGITGRDAGEWGRGGRGTWYRIESVPIGPRGKSWTRETEGYLAGNLLLSESDVTYPAYEGRLPWTTEEEGGVTYRRFDRNGLGVKLMTLDRATGNPVREGAVEWWPWEAVGKRGGIRAKPEAFFWRPDLLTEIFSPPAPRRIFPGTSRSIRQPEFMDQRDYFFSSEAKPPLQVIRSDEAAGWKILRRPGWASEKSYLLWKERVYEAIGGGVVLVKDYQDGQGFEPLALDGVIRPPRVYQAEFE